MRHPALSLLTVVALAAPLAAPTRAFARGKLGRAADAVLHGTARTLRGASVAGLWLGGFNTGAGALIWSGAGDDRVAKGMAIVGGAMLGGSALAHLASNGLRSTAAYARHQKRLDSGEILLRHRIADAIEWAGDSFRAGLRPKVPAGERLSPAETYLASIRSVIPKVGTDFETFQYKGRPEHAVSDEEIHAMLAKLTPDRRRLYLKDFRSYHESATYENWTIDGRAQMSLDVGRHFADSIKALKAEAK
jgi:hypothetical protein